MRIFASVLRLVAAVASVCAIVATLEASVRAGTFEFADFFGYFTIQGNLLCVVAFAIAAIAGLSRAGQAPWLQWFRGATTTYIAVVGIVYNTLLTNADVGVLVPWANSTLHAIIPLYAVLDWLLFSDRAPQRWRTLWFVLIYPAVWTIATLVRQAFEAHPFIPYPFMNVDRLGGGVVALYCVGIAAAFVLVGAGVWWASRAHVLRVPR